MSGDILPTTLNCNLYTTFIASSKLLQAVLHRTLAPPVGRKMLYGRSQMHWSSNRNWELRNRPTETSHTAWAAAITSAGCCTDTTAGQGWNFKGKQAFCYLL